MSFDALPHAEWPAIATVLPKPWPREAAAHHLRFHAAEHAVHGRKLPSVRDLADLWGWSTTAAYRLLASHSWADTARAWRWRADKVEHQRNTSGTPAEQTERLAANYSRKVEHQRNTSGTPAELTRDLLQHPSPFTLHPHTEPASAPAAALTPTPELTHDDRPADPTTGPDAHRPLDGSGGHVEQGGEAPARAREPEGDVGAPSGKGGAGPAVAAWELIDAIRRRNVKGAGRLTMTAAMCKAIKERLREHTANDLALMVEWVTGCRCGGPKCRACSWLQPKGYTHPKTYLRPDNCSEYLDLARQAESSAIVPTAAPADLMDNYRRLVGILCHRDDRRLIEGDDERHTLTLRYAVKLCGGRDAFRADPDAFLSRWPEVWAGAEAEVTAKLAAMGQP